MRRSVLKQRGGVMVQALIIIAGLLLLMATIAANQRVSMNAYQHQLRERRAEVAARAALQDALASLVSVNTSLVTNNDTWATLGNKGADILELGDATYRLEVIDACSRININTATQAQLQLLPMSQEQLSALLDWRDPGLQGQADGAKDSYYTALEVPYNTKLGRLTTLNELLLVKGWTAAALLKPQTDILSTAVTLEDDKGNQIPLVNLLAVDGAAPNTRADGTTRVNVNLAQVAPTVYTQFGIPQQTATLLVAQGPFTSFTTLLVQPGITATAAQQIIDGATFTATPRLEGKININTASEAVLRTIPNMTSDVAAAIVARQSTGFASLGELATLPGLSGVTLGQVADACGVGSDTWLVRAYGESGGVGVAVEAVIGVRNGTPRILTFDRLPNAGVPAWWNWEEGTNVTTQPRGLGT